MFKKKDKRFIVKETQSILTQVLYILVDTKTGVNYILNFEGGITPLLDEKGNVVVEKIKSYEE